MDMSPPELFLELVGRWNIHKSTLPLWLKGDKFFPSLNYSLDAKQPSLLKDRVEYRSRPWCPPWTSAATSTNLVLQTIEGWNSIINLDGRELQWRGSGVLMLVTSNWRVVLIEKARGIAVIYFSKTLFTPEGIDVIAKEGQVVDEKILRDVLAAACEADAAVARLAPLARTVPQQQS